MAAAKKSLVIPAIGTDKAEITFGCVAGEGMTNSEEDGFDYVVSMEVTDEMKEYIEEEILDFWEEHKPSWAKGEPDNFDNTFWESESGNLMVTFRTQTMFGNKQNNVPITDSQNNKLDPEVFGDMGAGSTGRAIIGLKVYEHKKKAGVSKYLEGVRLVTFSPYSASGLDIGDEEGEALGAGGAPAEEEPKKKKKKHGKK